MTKIFNKTMFVSALVCMCMVFLMNFGLFAVPELYPENIYENMVNASVRLPGKGSGVFIDDNVILTAAHCLKGEKSVIIVLSNGIKLKSSNFYIDKKEDIAFIFVDANEISIAKIVQSPVTIGDIVYLVGASHGFEFSLSKGIISHLDRDIPSMDWKGLLQTDAEGGLGSSGGPLYNFDGDLVGMYVGHGGQLAGGLGISLCEDIKSILEAYQRCKNAN